MTMPLSPDSPRRLAAARFGAELRKAMTDRGIGTKTLAPQARVSAAGIGLYRSGSNLPTIEVATRLAHALEWPALIAFAKNGRRGNCDVCGRRFHTEGGRPKRYCSPDCLHVAQKKRQGEKGPGVVLAEAIESELARVRDWGGTVKRTTLSSAVATFHADSAKGRRMFDMAAKKSADRQAAIDAMCRDCEPEGLCRTAACPLRAFSLLPLSKKALVIDTAEPAEGVHGPSHRDAWLVAQRAANERRWSRDGEREAASEAMRQRWQEHPELADLTRAGVARRSPESFSEASHKAWATRRAAEAG